MNPSPPTRLATGNRVSGHQVYDEPQPAVSILANALGVTTLAAREGLRALVEAGYFIGPRDPTNSMLLAYMGSYGDPPSNPASVVRAVSKARSRWRAMAACGTEMALSTPRLPPIVPANEAMGAEHDASDVSASAQSAGGRARAEALTSERRSEIARAAARRRWHPEKDGRDEPSPADKSGEGR